MIAWIIYAIIALVVVIYCFRAKTIGHVPDFRKPFSVIGLIIYTIIMLVCCSCASRKYAIQTEFNDSIKQVKSVTDSSNIKLQSDVYWMKEWMNNFSFDFSQKKTDFSAPDSVGKQYPINITETIGRVSESSLETDMYNERLNLQYTAIKKSIDSLSMIINYTQKKNPIIEKLSWWQTTLIWTGGIAWFIAFIALVLWTNKKLNWINLLLRLVKK